jgi:uncharacterized protein YdhG (YjbR/CyaY superfamily)
MASKRPTTIAAYIDAAPAAGQPQLRKLYALLKAAAPDAEETLKWGTPFFVEPRFVFAFSAHKAHLSFAPVRAVWDRYRADVEPSRTTDNMLKVNYDEPLPEALIRKIAKACVKAVAERESDGFWT